MTLNELTKSNDSNKGVLLPSLATKRQLLLIHLIILISYIGLTLPYTIFPLLYMKGNDTSQLLIYSMLISIYPLGQAIGMIIFGNLSDSFGRKLILEYTLLGAVTTFICSGIAVSIKCSSLLLILRFLCGLFEGNIAIALAAISDIQKDLKDKTKWFGRANIALTLGFMIGPFIGSIFSNPQIMQWFSYSTPFYVAAILSIITWILSRTYFRETNFNKKSINKNLLTKIKYKESYRDFCISIRQPKIKTFLMISLLITTALDIFYQFLPIYLINQWNAPANVLAIAVCILSIGKILGNACLIDYLNKFLRTPYDCILYSLIFISFGLLYISYIKLINVFILLVFLLGIPIALAVTNCLSIFSFISNDNKQGQALSTIQSLRMLTGAICCNFAAASCKITYAFPFFISIFFIVFALIKLLKYKSIFKISI